QPTVYNATLIGTNDPAGGQRGMVLRRGVWGRVFNSIVMGFPLGAIDVRDAASVKGTEEDPPALTVENSLFFENGADGKSHFSEGETDNDEGFKEEDFFGDAARHNVVDKDPELDDAYNLTEPGFVPAKASPAASGGVKPASGFENVTYLGAF